MTSGVFFHIFLGFSKRLNTFAADVWNPRAGKNYVEIRSRTPFVGLGAPTT